MLQGGLRFLLLATLRSAVNVLLLVRKSLGLDLCASLPSSRFVIPRDVPTLIPVEQIASLEPGQTTKQIFQFHFHQLAIFCNKKRYLVRLRSNIGYFIKPLSLVMDVRMDNGS